MTTDHDLEEARLKTLYILVKQQAPGEQLADALDKLYHEILGNLVLSESDGKSVKEIALDLRLILRERDKLLKEQQEDSSSLQRRRITQPSSNIAVSA